MHRIFAAACVALATGPGLAQDVTLTSLDGTLEISGALLGYDGDFYRLDTVYGELTVDGSGVTCTGETCPDPENFVARLRMSGSAAMGEVMMPALLEAFALSTGREVEAVRDNPHRVTHLLRDRASGQLVARVELGVTTADEGFADLLADQADIVLSTREIRRGERKLAREAGMGDLSGINRSRIIALDALVPIVSLANPVRQIGPQDLASVVAGRIVNWAELGGPDRPISLHLPDAGTGLGQAIAARLSPGGGGIRQDAARHPDSAAVARAVSADDGALGIAAFSDADGTRMLPLSGSCGFPLQPDRHSIKTEDYPLTAPLFVYIPARRLPKIAREFLAYLRSPYAQLVVRRAGFVDQTPEELGIEDQGRRLANAVLSAGAEIRLEELQRMVATLAPMQRLTTSFRFEAGSTRLDAQSRSNAEQLSRALERGRYDGRRLVFVGFSDGEGGAVANRDIALRRAEAVRRAVTAAVAEPSLRRVTLDVDAFGEALPMGCDDDPWGRQANRRVEVWVR